MRLLFFVIFKNDAFKNNLCEMKMRVALYKLIFTHARTRKTLAIILILLFRCGIVVVLFAS